MSTNADYTGAHRQSRLVDMMRSFANAHGGPGFGFKPRIDQQKRVTALVASCATSDLDVLGAAVAAGSDAVEIRVRTAADLVGLAGAVSRLKVPFGIALPASADAAAADQAAALEADWVRLPLEARVSTMKWEKPARLLTVPFDLNLDIARGLNGLAVEAVAVEQAPDCEAEFTYADALRLRALSDLVKKPFLLLAGVGLPPSAAVACADLGADALLVELDGPRSIDRLKAYRQALEKHITSES